MRKFDASKDYYAVLGISEGASKEEIDRAYRSEARRRHPDGGGSEEDMKSLNEAHDILSDQATRKAYDAERRPARPASYGSSMAYDPEAASRAGTLKIPVADADFAGLCISAAGSLAIGFGLLMLVEMQWVFFLWPLRLMSLGALGLGVFMAHSVLTALHRRMKEANPRFLRSRLILHEIAFWTIAAGGISLLLFLLYAA
ncbi:MAG: DnaJ domain-containing protein [Blastocatellia bacterium]|nr:DnaJ domain-containing protein [Blastocatellia bacterium]